MVNSEEISKKLLELLNSKLGKHILKSEISLGDAVVYVTPDQLVDFFNILKLDAELGFDFLASVTAVDWLEEREERFELVYHLMSMSHKYRLRVKVSLAGEEPEIDSVAKLWHSANFMEREVWDMYGVKFKGHPDLRRILMYEEFEGHPLRKDYPILGKQPRVKLRHPEVENTGPHMKRPELVKIGERNG